MADKAKKKKQWIRPDCRPEALAAAAAKKSKGTNKEAPTTAPKGE